ncbi:MAG: S8 family peptidase [Candidatus Thorarchaeota archaeon]|nr:S8 family peptidase [Candidatus Thorarchaeota archaeon]
MSKKFSALVVLAIMLTTFSMATTVVAYAQTGFDGRNTASAMYVWNDSDAETQWGIERIFNGVYDGYIPTADVDLAIVDTGIDLDHPDLMANIVWGYDAVRGRTADDGNGHGTHCAGIAGAIRNAMGVVGVYSNVDLYAIKVLGPSGSGTFTDIAEGVYAACKGPDGKEGTADDADVISMSLGGTSDSAELHNAIIHAYNMGIVIVAAAGNSGDGNPSTTEISYPAAYPEVIAVGATDMNDAIASFSNSGPYVEVAAPGVSIYSTYKGGIYKTLSGTSMACPHVAGLVALIIAVKGKMPVGTFSDTGTSTIRGYLHSTALDLGTSGWDASFGYGLIQASQLI